MEIKILGTKAPYCKNKDFCPGYLVETEKEKILLDCGNGITSQLDMTKDLENLIIIISHVHPDHYGDLSAIADAIDLYHKFGYISNKPQLYLPNINYEEVEEYYKGEDGWQSKRRIRKPIMNDLAIRTLGEEHYFDVKEYKQGTKIELQDMKITFMKTLHPINTYAAKIEDKTGILVYSADTGYEEKNLVNFAENADIFLCESSFLKGQVRAYNYHLYAHEAAKIAKTANVGQLVLTHFWPEIDKSSYVKEAKEIFENTIAAEPGKVLRLSRR